MQTKPWIPLRLLAWFPFLCLALAAWNGAAVAAEKIALPGFDPYQLNKLVLYRHGLLWGNFDQHSKIWNASDGKTVLDVKPLKYPENKPNDEHWNLILSPDYVVDYRAPRIHVGKLNPWTSVVTFHMTDAAERLCDGNADILVTRNPTSGKLSAWETATGKLKFEYGGKLELVSDARLSSDGSTLAVVGQRKPKQLSFAAALDPKTGKSLRLKMGQLGPIELKAVSADGKLLAVRWPNGQDDGRIDISGNLRMVDLKPTRGVDQPMHPYYGAVIGLASADLQWFELTFSSLDVPDNLSGKRMIYDRAQNKGYEMNHLQVLVGFNPAGDALVLDLSNRFMTYLLRIPTADLPKDLKVVDLPAVRSK